MNTKTALERALAAKGLTNKQAAPQQEIKGSFAEGVARQLESKGIAKVPGLSQDDDQQTWVDRFIEYGQGGQAFEAQREGLHDDAAASTATPHALNSDALLHSVLSKLNGGQS